MPIHNRVYDLSVMDKIDAQKLLETIWEEVHSKTFTTDPKESFCNYLLDPKFSVKKIQVLYDKDNVIGYIAYRVIEKKIANESYGIVRLTSCMLSNYRGANSITSFAAQEIIKYYLSKLFSRLNIVIFYTANSPASYYIYARNVHKIYPSPYDETPPKIKGLITEMAKYFGIEIVDNTNLTTEFKGFRIYESEEEIASWNAHPHPAITYYLKKCPDYHNGQSLIVMIPVTFYNIAHTVVKAAYDLLLKTLGFRKSSYKQNIGQCNNGISAVVANSPVEHTDTEHSEKSNLLASNANVESNNSVSLFHRRHYSNNKNKSDEDKIEDEVSDRRITHGMRCNLL